MSAPAYQHFTTDAVSVDVTDEQIALLRLGAYRANGLICAPYQAKGKDRPVFVDLARKRLITWWDHRVPMITPEGMAFVKALDASDGTAARRLAEARALAESHKETAEEAAARERRIKDFNRWDRLRMQAILVVRHPHPSTAAIMVSRCGDVGAVSFLPIKKIEIRPVSTDQFLMVMVPDWLRKKLPSAFSGMTPELFGDNWTDRERDEWRDLRLGCSNLNRRIATRWQKPRKSYSPMPYGYTA